MIQFMKLSVSLLDPWEDSLHFSSNPPRKAVPCGEDFFADAPAKVKARGDGAQLFS